MTEYQKEQFPIPTPRRLWRELRLRRPPWWMVVALVVVVIGTWVPLYLIYRERAEFSTSPKIHFIQDMDLQPGYRAQQSSPLFADGRAMRAPISGTVARGQLREDDHFYRGYRNVTAASATPIEFFAEFPKTVVVSQALTDRGRERYNIYCVVCHDHQGSGKGIVHERALALKETKWVPPTNLLTQTIRDYPVGQIFQAVSNGVRNMPGYRSQISAEDRWAIIAYVKHLQATQPVAEEEQPKQNK